MMLPLIILLQTATVDIASSNAAECEQSTLQLLGSASGSDSRVVITFTGSQSALLPLDERVGGAAESTLFPIGTDSFVLTVQVRPSATPLADVASFAKQVCSIGTSSGGRFNGVMSFVHESVTVAGRTLARERMTEAAMAKLPTK